MEGLCRAVAEGEQCLQCKNFYAALSQCESMNVRGDGTGDDIGGDSAPGDMLSCPKGRKEGIEITLENRELWNQFNDITNEMIVTKAGR